MDEEGHTSVVLHADLDCFYAAVLLISLPLTSSLIEFQNPLSQHQCLLGEYDYNQFFMCQKIMFCLLGMTFSKAFMFISYDRTKCLQNSLDMVCRYSSFPSLPPLP